MLLDQKIHFLIIDDFAHEKRPLESVKTKTSKTGFRHVPSRPKWRLEPKFHEAGTFGGWEKRGHTDRQDSRFISIDFFIIYYQFPRGMPAAEKGRLVWFTMSHRMDSWIPVHLSVSTSPFAWIVWSFNYSCGQGSPFIHLFLHPSSIQKSRNIP